MKKVKITIEMEGKPSYIHEFDPRLFTDKLTLEQMASALKRIGYSCYYLVNDIAPPTKPS